MALSPPSFRRVAMLACALLPLALSGCGIETYRSWTGVNRNDPDPQTALFTGNLAEAETGSYPNLATVPEPPTTASTAAERQKLSNTLMAERAATEASAKVPEGLAPAGAAAKPSDKTTAKNGAVAGAAPGSSAKGALPGQNKTASNDQIPRRGTDEPPEPGPRDSPMQMPDVRSTPQPEATRAAPAPAALGRVSPPAAFAAPPAEAAAMPPPPPSTPVLAPIVPPPPTASAALAPRPSPLASTVATLALPAGASLDGNGQQQVDHVAALYKEKPGNVRVVARTAPPAPGTDPLIGYHAALEGAQAVADALKRAGIPANKIQTEASSNVGAAGANSGRIEIQLAP